MAIRFTSALQTSYREELEALVFFNTNQPAFARDIIDTNDRYGLPRIIEHGQSLILAVGTPNSVQTLYALDARREQPELIGALIYTRVDVETIVMLHMTLKEEFCLNGKQSQDMLAIRFFDELKAIARKIKGVRFVRIAYGDGGKKKLAVRH